MWRGFRAGARRPTADEIARELRDHLELEAEELAARSAEPAGATYAARRRFGNVALTTEAVREVWRLRWAEQIAQDVRHGCRGLLRSPAYAITAMATLGLGIGASTAVFSLGDHVLERPFPLLPQSALVWIVQRSGRCPTCDNASPAAYMALSAGAPSMTAVGAAALWRATLRGPQGSDLVSGYLVSANLFSLISAPFALGRGFAPDADHPGKSDVAILSYDYWQQRFSGSRGVLDSTIVLDGDPRRVVGVLAKGLAFPTQADVYAPLVLTAADVNDHASRYLDIFGRLAPGATLAAAQREAAVISKRLAMESAKTDGDWMLVPRPLKAFHADDVALLVEIFAVAVALVLLAACVSVANLALARTAARRRELALRAALGARRGRLARHLLVEAMLVALAGGVLGIGLASWSVRAIADVIPTSLSSFAPGFALIRVDGRALVFTLALCIGATLLFALLPVLRATRVPLSTVLTDGGRASAGDAYGARLRAGLVVAEVSVALVLLTGAALLARSVRNMLRGDPGVRLDHVLTMHLSLPRGVSDSAARDFVARLDARLHREPGVLGAGLVSTTPLSNSWWGTTFDIPGRPPPPDGNPLNANDQHITPDYFRTMAIRVLRGRGIDGRDVIPGAQRVAVINHYMAERLWPGTNAVGQVITIASEQWTIVGIASDVRHGGFDEALRYEIYRPIAQAVALTVDVDVWTAGDPSLMRQRVRRAVADVDPAAAVGDMITMREMEARHVSPFRLMADVVGAFAAITMLIAVVGLYGVIAYGVAQRRREIAVRIALGARVRDILSYVAGGAVRLAVIGIVIGVAGAFAFAQLLRSVLYGVPATDPVTPLVVAASLLGVSIAAALIPSWRASRLNPMINLND